MFMVDSKGVGVGQLMRYGVLWINSIIRSEDMEESTTGILTYDFNVGTRSGTIRRSL